MLQLIDYLKNVSGSKKQIASWAIVIILLAPFVIYALPQIIGAEDALIVQSGSMEPAIPTGSVIVIYDAQPTEIQENDIITFSSGESPVTGEKELTTHRVIGVDRSGDGFSFRTKGDNNEDPDPTSVSGDQVVGEHAFTIPYLGYLLVELRSTNAFILLVLIPAVLLILNELMQIRSEASQLKRQGKDQELIGTAVITTAIFLSIIAAGFYTGKIPELIQQTGFDVSLGPTVLGVLMMVSMLISMIVLKFI